MTGISGVSGVTTNILGGVRAEIESATGEFQWKLDFLILNRITENIPQIQVDAEALCLPYDMRLADQAFNSPGHIELLLGASVFYDSLLAGQMGVSKASPIPQKSKLGWIVSGPLNIPNVTPRLCIVSQSTIENQIGSFWTLEEAEGTAVKLSKEEAWLRSTPVIHIQGTQRVDSLPNSRSVGI